GRAVAELVDVLAQRALAHEPLHDARTQLAADLLVELDPVAVEEIALLGLQSALEFRERYLLAVDLRRVVRADHVEIEVAPKNERQGDQAEDDYDDRTAESVTYCLQHDSPEVDSGHLSSAR